MILICIAVDRYFAFVHPLSFYKMRERNKKMVCFAWTASVLLSIPQVIGSFPKSFDLEF